MKYYGHLTRVFKGAYSFDALHTYPEELSTPVKRPNFIHFETPKLQLQAGDRLTVFNSVAAGRPLWKNELHFPADSNQSSVSPEGIAQDHWEAMFNASLPAKIIRPDGETIEGKLERCTDWPNDNFHLVDYKKNGADSLHQISNGDVLEVFATATEGEILWQGFLETPEFPAARAQPVEDMRRWLFDTPVLLERN